MLSSLLKKAKQEAIGNQGAPGAKTDQFQTGQESKAEIKTPIWSPLYTVSLATSQPLLDRVYYFPGVISQLFSDALWDYVDLKFAGKWVELPHAKRKLLRIGGSVEHDGLRDQEPLDGVFEELASYLLETKLVSLKPNHILLNHYPIGSGIQPHTDGPLYSPHVCILSQGSSSIFEFCKSWEDFKNGKTQRVFVESQSLFFFSGDAYLNQMHSIRDLREDTINVTLEKTKNASGAESISVHWDVLNSGEALGGLGEIEKGIKRLNKIEISEMELEEIAISSLRNQKIEVKKIQKKTETHKEEFILFIPRSTRRSLTIRHVQLAAPSSSKSN